MSFEIPQGISEEDASQLMELARKRLPNNRGSISAAVFEVLEIPYPPDAYPMQFKKETIKFAFGSIAESFHGDS